MHIIKTAEDIRYTGKRKKDAFRRRKRPGLTLIELVAVISIIAVVMAGLVSSVTNHVNNAKYATAISDLVALKSAIDQYMITHNGTLIGLVPNGTTTGALTGSTALANMDGLDPFLSQPVANTYDPWGRAYQIKATYNSTTNQGDVAIYVMSDTALGLNGTDVSYMSVSPNGTKSTFSVTGVAVNPLRRVRGAAGDQGEPMAIRVMGQYEMQ